MEKKFVLRTSRGREYPIESFTRIGRDSDCLMRYTDMAISRHHASVWVVQNGLWLKDDNSSGGVFVNGQRIAPDQAHQLHSGDRVRLGNSQIELEVLGQGVQSGSRYGTSPGTQSREHQPANPGKTAPGPARRLTPIACATMLGCLFVFGLVALSSSYFFLGGGITGLLPGQAKVLATSTSQPLLNPQEYAASSQTLAQAVAKLNQSELAFIQTVHATTSYLPKVSLARLAFTIHMNDPLDDELRQVAADAFHVATLAASLSQTAVAQDGGSENAGQVAAQYTSISQLGAALVIEAQDLRAGLAQGSVTQATAAAVIAEYGARLWNPAVADPESPDNPFSAYLGDTSAVPVAQLLSPSSAAQIAEQFGADLSSWVATSGEGITKKFIIPNVSFLEDAALVADLLTPEGQADGDAAKQAAAAILQAGGGSVSSQEQAGTAQVTVSFNSAMTVNSPDGPAVTPPRTMSVFPKGSVTIINEPSSDNVISNLFGVDDKNNPMLTGQVPVQDTQPLITLSISNLSITEISAIPKNSFSTYEAQVSYEFDVTWQSNVAAPQFSLVCASSEFDISAPSGTKHVTATKGLILYPGAEDAYCHASRKGNSWGSAIVRFLVGNAAGATQRVDQLNTQVESSRLTDVANEKTRLAVEVANAAATLTAKAIVDAVSTEVYGTQTAEFSALITEIARQTELAPTPENTSTPTPTATFEPKLLETFFHPGDVHTVTGGVRLQRGRLYRICLSGTMYITSGPVYPSDVDYVNGIKVPLSGCVVVEGNGAVATISCSKGEPAEDPGGFTVQVFDLGPD